jgi:hypothetical protein
MRRGALLRAFSPAIALAIPLALPRRGRGDVPSAASPSRDPDAESKPAEPDVKPTVAWVLTQLIPSPEVALGRVSGAEDARFGLRWQVTPVLYSFGIDRRLSPWRAIVVEPIVRQSGSVELFVSPEIFTGSLWGSAMIRGGIRSYFPLVAKGEELSVSLGTSYTNLNGQSGASLEVGGYVLYGTVGLQVTYSPSPSPVPWIFTFRIRYF